MGHWATGVAVVTMCNAPEERGTTVNSFTSVSLDPPLIRICLDQRSRTRQLILEARRFCVNVLDDRQQVLSQRFAGHQSDSHAYLGDCSHNTTTSGVPILGLVEEVRITSEGKPVIFFQGRYASLGHGIHEGYRAQEPV